MNRICDHTSHQKRSELLRSAVLGMQKIDQLKLDWLVAAIAITAVGTGVVVDFWLLNSLAKHQQIKADH